MTIAMKKSTTMRSRAPIRRAQSDASGSSHSSDEHRSLPWGNDSQDPHGKQKRRIGKKRKKPSRLVVWVRTHFLSWSKSRRRNVHWFQSALMMGAVFLLSVVVLRTLNARAVFIGAGLFDGITGPHSILDSISRDFRLSFRKMHWTKASLEVPRTTVATTDDDEQLGGLDIKFFVEDGHRRSIFRYEHDAKSYDEINPDADDNVDYYYAFDDDVKRNPANHWSDDQKMVNRPVCRRVNWHRLLLATCNNLHEFDLQTRMRLGETKYVGGGVYREVYMAKMPTETVVFKTFYWGAGFHMDDYEFMRMDAIVSERLTGEPSIVQLYSFCALSSLNEPMPNGDLEALVGLDNGRVEVHLNDKDDVDPRNSLTPEQKITFALEMAEEIAILHSFRDGIMVHDDIQLSQFLLTPDKQHLKLNDFNRAEIMLWDDVHKQYCKYRNNPGHGDWRAPEEYYDYPLDESIDVWSYGNNLYSILTGLHPFYDLLHTNDVRKAVKAGKTAYIDPRWKNHSYPEKMIAEIIPKCWEYKPEDRMTIFELVTYFRNAMMEYKRLKAEGLEK